jgi:energy-coupling factor transporter ATP-binding protein EcfA2
VLPNEYSSRQYPGFVSFIGDTGIGKSTLVKAMILMGGISPSGTQYKEDGNRLERRINVLRKTISKRAYGPVSKSASLSQMTDPTSFGVHLYRDVAASDHESSRGLGDSFLPRDTPILFADCEGFRAGYATANAERMFAKVSRPNLLIDAPITSKSYGTNGKDGIDLFYARFLYTVSDVVVLVMRGDTEFYPTMQRLLEWAASAVYRSVNHLAQKTLVIVRNMAVFHHEDLYNPKILRESLFANLGDLCKDSTLLQRFRNEYNDRRMTSGDRIDSNEDLFAKFFSEIRVCNIPDTGKAPSNEVFAQYQYLRQQIVTASQKSQELRSMNWMQYNVPTLSHILNRAFGHFRTSEGPFDFYQAARRDNPDPVSVSDHISNFIRHTNLRKNFHHMATSRIIAVNLVVWALRNFDTGRISQVLPTSKN